MLFHFFNFRTLLAGLLLYLPAICKGQSAKHVILISIDGFRPDFYKHQEWGTPNLKMLAENGAYADHVVTIFPSVTYPSHTTLVTGKRPDEHGVAYNTSIDENSLSGEWVTDYRQIKAKTIWEAAKEKRLTTAAVSWPIVTSAPWIDYNIPEIWSKTNQMDRVSAGKELATPKGLFDEVMANATGNLEIKDYNISTLSMDENLSRMASYIFQKYKPALLTIHLPNADGAQHRNGRSGDEVSRAVSGADHAVSNIYDGVRKAGLLDSTVIIITGDHGFVTTSLRLSPNILLKKAGLFDKAYFFAAGGSAFLRLRKNVKAEDGKLISKRVVDLLKSLPDSQQRYYKLISHREIVSAGADTAALLALSGSNGACFDSKADADFVSKTAGGQHGYYFDNSDIYTGFIINGPSIKKQIIPSLQLTDIAGIISEILRLDLEHKNAYQFLFSER